MTALTVPEGFKLVPIEPTPSMIVMGFESAPDRHFSDPDAWNEYEAMSGCQQAAHRAKLCYAAMLAAAPEIAPLVATQDDIAGLDRLELLALAATQGKWEYGSTPVYTPDEALEICRQNIEATDAPILQFYEVFLDDGRRTALIGNGPTSAANAEYIASLHPANMLYLVGLVRRALAASVPAVSPVASDAQDNEVLAMLARVLKYIDPHAVDMELARTGPMEGAYINTIARKCVERHLARAEAAPAIGAAK